MCPTSWEVASHTYLQCTQKRHSVAVALVHLHQCAELCACPAAGCCCQLQNCCTIGQIQPQQASCGAIWHTPSIQYMAAAWAWHAVAMDTAAAIHTLDNDCPSPQETPRQASSSLGRSLQRTQQSASCNCCLHARYDMRQCRVSMESSNAGMDHGDPDQVLQAGRV